MAESRMGAVIGAIVACIALSSPLTAQKYPRHEISELGVRFKVHEGLKRDLGPATRGRYLRARFEIARPRDRVKGLYGKRRWELQVYEFTDRRTALGEGGGGKKASGSTMDTRMTWKNTFAEWVTPTTGGVSDHLFAVKGEQTEARGKKLGYTWWEYIDRQLHFNHNRQQTKDRLHRIACVYECGPGREIALVVTLPVGKGGRAEKQYQNWARTMLLSFSLLKPSAMSEASEGDERDSWARNELQREALRKAKITIADLDHWGYFTSPNYIVLYSWAKQAGRKRSLKYAEHAAANLEEMRQKYLEYFPLHEGMSTTYPVLRIHAVRDEFDKYRDGSGGIIPKTWRNRYHAHGFSRHKVQGVFKRRSRELVIFYDAKGKQAHRDLTSVAACHGGWHQFADAYFPSTHLGHWFDEGLADFFGCFKRKGKKWTYVPSSGRIQALRDHVPTQRLLSMTRMEFLSLSAGSRNYAQGYAVIDFLVRGKKLGDNWDPTWNQVLPRYTQSLIETKDQQKALDAAFAGIDWVAFDKAWEIWVAKHIKKKGL